MKRSPFFKGVVFFLLICLLSNSAFCKTKEIRFEDQSYTLFVSSDKKLFITGPWSDEPMYLDEHVRDVWARPNVVQIVLMIQKDDEIDWMALKRETGEKIMGGVLQPLVAEDGFISYCAVQFFPSKLNLKIVFDDGRYLVYEVDPAHGTKKIVRKGKIPHFGEGK